ncbi:MAG: bifunctional 2-polyprenyl-6-hydroxyphenol methylase/3-demethylubiquinol 3-O-methyltransferase UbiG [Pseudomonadota bacterium]
MTASDTPNVDPAEVAKFDALAERWWDPDGESGPLHAINPLRLGFITDHTRLRGATAVDVGCGGGLLSEAMARRGAAVTGIDQAQSALEVARRHAEDQDLDLTYQHTTAEALAERQPGTADIVTCMEMLEHVPEPGAVVAACATLLKPGGRLFLSTINRNPKSYALAVIGAEYVLRLLPRGTHDYQRFLKPSELDAFARDAGLAVEAIKGIVYNPLTREYRVSDDIDVNYMMCFTRDLAGS